MWWLVGGLFVFLCLCVLALALCRAASRADDVMEKIMEDREERC